MRGSRTGPTRRLPRPLGFGLAVAAALLLAAPVQAQFTLVEGDGVRLGLSGYVRSITGIHDRGYDIPDLPGVETPPRTTGFNGEVLRFKWRLEGGSGTAGAGTSWELNVHNRVQARVQSAGTDGQVVGFGVSTVPDRLVDLESVLVDEPGLRAWHDLDRLSLSVYTDIADITVGRQAITWGTSSLFPVADLWAQFSPFELDTEEKPGIDAVRVLAYPAGIEVDAVVADRGTAEELSAGVRATFGLPGADVWVGAGKFWRQAMAMGGVTWLLDAAKLRAEIAVPWSLDGGGSQEPRATLGIDWIRGTMSLTGEYHYNGIGTASGDYSAVLSDPRVQRGETYYLGRHYLGGLVSWSPDVENRVTLVLNALGNLQDPSVAITPLVSYDLGQATRIALGGLISTGDEPVFSEIPPRLPSEFGAYGILAFTQLSIYF